MRYFVALGLIVALLLGGKFYSDHRKQAVKVAQARERALSHCGQAAVDKATKTLMNAQARFNRAAKTADAAPRIGLSPLLLEMRAAKDEARQAGEVPCLIEAVASNLAAMQGTINAYEGFATGGGREVAGEFLRLARAEAERADLELAQARQKAVH